MESVSATLARTPYLKHNLDVFLGFFDIVLQNNITSETGRVVTARNYAFSGIVMVIRNAKDDAH